jgi:hypothetical protein
MFLLLSLAAGPFAAPLAGQQLDLERGVRVGGLWCFPLTGNARHFVYLPASARLSTDEGGAPKFSFVRYVSNRPSVNPGAATLTAASGGGVLHFLVELDTPADAVSAARAALRDLLPDDDVELRGPVVFDDGRYLLVSSILEPEPGSAERRQILASGRAPVLEGNRLAFSFDLEPQEATLLLESFKMATPDVSIVFDMTFHGLAQAYQAELVVDWSEVRKSEAFSAGASVYFVSADVEVGFEKLRRDNAIRLVTSGSDATMEALLDAVYGKLLELLFRPVEPETVPEDQRGGLMDALAALVDTKSGPLGSRNTTGFGAYAGYQLKEMRSSGLSVLDFNHRSTVQRHAFLTFNIGDLHRRYGDDPSYFRAVNLEDPTFQQREIRVGIDGALLGEFDRLINSATVTLRKRHDGGGVTLRELVVDRSKVEESAGDLRMVYGWKQDTDRLAWLEYDTRTRWSFKGGGAYETDWKATDAAMVELFAPYERRTIELTGDFGTLAARGVRAVVVQIEYPFFGERRRQQLVARVDAPPDARALEVTLPRDEFEVDYTITWRLQGNQTLVSHGRDATGLLFIDELPADTEPAPGAPTT